uniref:Uncharacterized protein n=1 Tax=Lepeophtheirus salmonis TaxID=72036 RepID=A0A0K2U4J8_LEPSM
MLILLLMRSTPQKELSLLGVSSWAPILVAKLNAEFIYSKYTLIMKNLNQIGFIDVGAFVDNYTVNRKFFTHFLCGG